MTQLIILAIYISVNGLPRQEAQVQISDIIDTFRDSIKCEGYQVEIIVLPTKGDTDIKCVYPVFDNTQEVQKMIQDTKELLKENYGNQKYQGRLKWYQRLFKLNRLTK